MPVLSSRTLAIVRARVADTLTERCTIERETLTRGTMGEPLHQWVAVASDMPCRVIRGKQGGYQDVGATESLVERYRVIFPLTAYFKTDDRIRMTSGEVYQVVDVVDKWSDGAFVAALVAGVRDGG